MALGDRRPSIRQFWSGGPIRVMLAVGSACCRARGSCAIGLSVHLPSYGKRCITMPNSRVRLEGHDPVHVPMNMEHGDACLCQRLDTIHGVMLGEDFGQSFRGHAVGTGRLVD